MPLSCVQISFHNNGQARKVRPYSMLRCFVDEKYQVNNKKIIICVSNSKNLKLVSNGQIIRSWTEPLHCEQTTLETMLLLHQYVHYNLKTRRI
jgi:hypothetical protein